MIMPPGKNSDDSTNRNLCNIQEDVMEGYTMYFSSQKYLHNVLKKKYW